MLATTGVIWSAAYMLWVYERTFYGVVKQRVNQTLPDVNARERPRADSARGLCAGYGRCFALLDESY